MTWMGGRRRKCPPVFYLAVKKKMFLRDKQAGSGFARVRVFNMVSFHLSGWASPWRVMTGK
jgi:hypothetical protein